VSNVTGTPDIFDVVKCCCF